MHELLLFGSVPSARHDQVLNVLAGIAAMQPQAVLEKHLIFRPNRNAAMLQEKQVGGAQDVQKKAQAVQAQEFFHLQLVADAKDRSEGAAERDTKENVLEDRGDDVIMGDNGEKSASVKDGEGGQQAVVRCSLWKLACKAYEDSKTAHPQMPYSCRRL